MLTKIIFRPPSNKSKIRTCILTDKKSSQSTPYHQLLFSSRCLLLHPRKKPRGPWPAEPMLLSSCLHVSEMCRAQKRARVRHWGTVFPLTIKRLLRYNEINLDQLQALNVETDRYTELSDLADTNVI